MSPEVNPVDVPLGETSDFFALIDAAILIEKTLDKSLSAIDLNAPQLRMLIQLSFATEPLSPSELADVLVLEVQTVSKMIDRLEQRGLLRRGNHPVDRRSILIDLTLEGESKALRGLEVLSGVADKFKGPLRSSTVDLLAGLHRLQQAALQAAGLHLRPRQRPLN